MTLHWTKGKRQAALLVSLMKTRDQQLTTRRMHQESLQMDPVLLFPVDVPMSICVLLLDFAYDKRVLLQEAAVGGWIGFMRWAFGGCNNTERTKALWGAARAGQLMAIQWIHYHDKSDTESKHDVLYEALNEASRYGKHIIVHWILTTGAFDVDDALCFAAQNGHLVVVRCLARWRNHAVSNALFHACSNGHTWVVQFLMQLLVKDGDFTDLETSFRNAVTNYRMPVVRLLITEHRKILERPGILDRTMLAVSKNGDMVMVDFLLSMGVSPNIALNIAVVRNKLAMVRLIVERPESEQIGLGAALILAIQHGRRQIAQYFIEAGADMSVVRWYLKSGGELHSCAFLAQYLDCEPKA